MTHYSIPGYVVDCKVEKEYYDVAAKFLADNDNFYVPRLLKYMISVEAAKVCCEYPATAEDIAEKLGWDVETVEKYIKESIVSGLAHKNHANGKVNFAASIVNIADYGIVNPELIKKWGKGFLDLVKGIRTSEEYLGAYSAKWKAAEAAGEEYVAPPAEFRILPKWKAIKDIPGVMPCENLLDILMEQEHISSVRCMCRTVMRNDDVAWEGELPEEGHCIKFGKVAEHFVEDMELGRYMSVEEVMKNLEILEDKPNYHMIGNSREVRGGFCNCCTDCCDMRMAAMEYKKFSDGIMPSRFVTVVDQESCIGCGKCAELCPFFESIKLVDGKAVVNEETCMGCGICVVNCPEKALSMIINKPVSHIPENGPQHILDSLNLAE